MFSKRVFFWPMKSIPAVILILCSLFAAAQHHGGVSGGVPGGLGRPDGVDEKDSLQDFHHSMAVQASNEQIAAFQALVKNTEAAKTELETFRKSDAKPTASNSKLDQALDTARDNTKKFVDGFSDKQKNGLKDLTKRIEKADITLDQEQKKLDQSLLAAVAAPADATRADGVDKALSDFSSEQLALGREMGIIFANGNDQTFAFTPVKTTANIGNQSTVVTVSGGLVQVSAEGGQRRFKLEMTGDLLELQQNITPLLRPQIEKGNSCGERLALRQATIMPASPASVVTLHLHYERWSCHGSVSSEMAEGDGSVEMRLTPAVEKAGTEVAAKENEKSNSLKLTAEYSRIDATGMMGDSLRSGDLGDDLRDAVIQSILPAVRAGANFKATLPPAVQDSAVVEVVKFQDATAGRLSVVLDGRMEASNEQVNLMASQLNQNLAAQGTAAPGTTSR